jgi:hypothetical protein
MNLLEGRDEEKVLLVASAKCLCEFPSLRAAQPELWAALRDAAVKQAQGERGDWRETRGRRRSTSR